MKTYKNFIRAHSQDLFIARLGANLSAGKRQKAAVLCWHSFSFLLHAGLHPDLSGWFFLSQMP